MKLEIIPYFLSVGDNEAGSATGFAVDRIQVSCWLDLVREKFASGWQKHPPGSVQRSERGRQPPRPKGAVRSDLATASAIAYRLRRRLWVFERPEISLENRRFGGLQMLVREFDLVSIQAGGSDGLVKKPDSSKQTASRA